jgi:hypothetical protein
VVGRESSREIGNKRTKNAGEEIGKLPPKRS